MRSVCLPFDRWYDDSDRGRLEYDRLLLLVPYKLLPEPNSSTTGEPAQRCRRVHLHCFGFEQQYRNATGAGEYVQYPGSNSFGFV